MPLVTPLRRLPGRWAGRLRLVAAVATVLFPPLALAGESRFPMDGWWDSAGDPLVVLLVVAAAGTIGQGLDAIVRERGQRREEARADMRRFARKALGPINRHLPGAPIEKLGVHIWAVSGERLERVVKYTVENERVVTPIAWTRGKGAIGVAWARHTAVVADLTDLYAEAAQLTPSVFDALDEEHRYGLSHAEVAKGNRYRSVLAHPLTGEQNDVIGVLSVDCGVDSQSGQLDALLDDPTFQDVLGACESALRSYLES